MRNEDLIKEAMKAREEAYAPYSGFKVHPVLLQPWEEKQQSRRLYKQCEK